MNRRYDVLLCDADNTIFDFEKAEENAFYLTCEMMGLPKEPALLETYGEINSALWRLLEKGGITQAVLRVRRFEQFLEAIGRTDIDAPLMAATYADQLGMQSVPLEGAIEALARWSKILPVIIVTNGISKIQHGRMERSEARHFIRGMIISEEVGVAKPEAKMLEIGMDMAGVSDRTRALMLGDSLSSDIGAAANAGVDACWFNPKGLENTKGLPVRYEIRCLDEVDAILTGENA